MKWSVQKSFVDAVRFRPGHDEYTPLGSGWTAESEIGAVQRNAACFQNWMEHSCLFSDSTLPRWPLTKYATTLAKGIHSFKYFLPLWFFYSLRCSNMVTFVKNINSVTWSSARLFSSYYKWYSNHIERLACSALIPHLSPNSNELKGSFHTNCFFRMIIQAINCKEALLVYREIRPNEINTRSPLIRICSASEQNACWCLDRKKARKFESIFPIRDADA